MLPHHLPPLRPARRDGVHLRRRGGDRLPGRPGRAQRPGVGGVPLRAREPPGSARRALVPLQRMPALVRRRPRHRHPGRLVSGRRLPEGGTAIDRSRPLRFTFDGVPLTGFAGDTLASALLAAGVDVVARSIHHGRPRGIVAAGAEEPSALVRADGEPMVQATRVRLREGLVASSLAMRGALDGARDPRRHDRMHAHCDVLVAGAGPAGRAAAEAAARTGARVILACAGDAPDIGPFDELRVLPWTTAVGNHDHGLVVLDERGTRLWHVRARRGRRRDRRARAPPRLRRQRPPRRDARRRRAHVPRALRRGRGRAPGRPDGDGLGRRRGRAARRGGPRRPRRDRDVRGAGRRTRRGGGGRRPAHPVRPARRLRGLESRAAAVDPGSGRRRLGRADGVPPAVRVTTGHAGRRGGRGRRRRRRARVRPPVARRRVGPPLRRPAARRDDRRHAPRRRRRHALARARQAPHDDRHRRRPGQGAATSSRSASSPGCSTCRSATSARRRRGRPTSPSPSRCTPGATAARCTTRSARPRCTRGTSRTAPSSRTSASGSGRSASRAPARARTTRSCASASRPARTSPRWTPRPWARSTSRARMPPSSWTALYTNVMSTVRVGAGRYGVMCSADGMVFDDGVALRLGGGPLPHHDDDRERRRGPRLAGGVAADRVARSAGAADLGDRALGDGRGRRPPLARGRRGSGSGDGCERGRLRLPARPRRGRRRCPGAPRAGELLGRARVRDQRRRAPRRRRVGGGHGRRRDAATARRRCTCCAPRRATSSSARRPTAPRRRRTSGSSGSSPTPSPTSSAGARTRGPARWTRTASASWGCSPSTPASALPEGAQLVVDPDVPPPVPMVGHVTSSYRSAALGRTFALGLVRGGTDRVGEVLHAPLEDRTVAVTVAEPVLFDPGGDAPRWPRVARCTTSRCPRGCASCRCARR